ncbi:MAG: diguanylate cyclase [Rhodoferax sp.]|nr:diguanylate cyclase [Rhodoferax sp.]
MTTIRSSLVAKLAFAVVFLILLPSTLLTIYWYERDRAAAIDVEMRHIQSYSKNVANEIDSFLLGQRDIARYGAVSQELRGFLRKQGDPGTMLEFNAWLTYWSKISDHIGEVFVLDLKGNCVAATDASFVGKDYSLRPYFQDAIRGLDHVSDWTIGITSRKAGVYLSSPIKVSNSTIGGIIVIKLNLAPIDAIILRSQGLGVQTFLVNREGVLLAHYDPTLRYATLDDLSAKESDWIRQTRQFADLPQKSLGLKSLRQDIGHSRPGETLMSQEYNFGGDRKVAALTGLQANAWVVGVTSPLSVIESRGKQRFSAVAPMIVLVILFTLLASFYLIRFVVRPLNELLQKTRLLSAGDYSVEAQAIGTDEVSQLAKTFNNMARTIRLHTDELEHRVAQRTAELEKAVLEIKQLSITDALTGCFNRHHMNEQLAREIERSKRYGRALSILMCDIDHFKRVNDTWGHPAGDEVLRLVSAALRDNLRHGSDWVARFGGEEFLIVFPETSLEDASVLGEKLRMRIEDLVINLDQQVLHVTASFGLACLRPGDGDNTLEVLLARADAMLYLAKRGGRNRLAIDSSDGKEQLTSPSTNT